MAEFTVFTQNGCWFCDLAKKMLTTAGHTVAEKNISTNPELRQEVASAKTMPQIFLGEFHIGGQADLAKLIESGQFEGVVAVYAPDEDTPHS